MASERLSGLLRDGPSPSSFRRSGASGSRLLALGSLPAVDRAIRKRFSRSGTASPSGRIITCPPGNLSSSDRRPDRSIMAGRLARATTGRLLRFSFGGRFHPTGPLGRLRSAPSPSRAATIRSNRGRVAPRRVRRSGPTSAGHGVAGCRDSKLRRRDDGHVAVVAFDAHRRIPISDEHEHSWCCVMRLRLRLEVMDMPHASMNLKRSSIHCGVLIGSLLIAWYGIPLNLWSYGWRRSPV